MTIIKNGTSVETILSYNDFLGSGFPTKVPLSPIISPSSMVEGSPIFCAKLNQIKFGAALAVLELARLWALHTADATHGVAFRKHKAVTPDEEMRNCPSTPPKLTPVLVLILSSRPYLPKRLLAM